MNIVINTNRFISALMKEGTTREIILNTNDYLLLPEFEFQEISKYKKEILEKSGLSEIEFNILLVNLLTKVKIIKTDIMPFKEMTDKIMKVIDEDDIIFIAAALVFNCSIWFHDEYFKRQDRIRILTNKYMMERLK
ncbi:MAG: PIN domain-containing protein [Nanoarchaeota archaeon]